MSVDSAAQASPELASETEIVRVEGLTKVFPNGVRALSEVGFRVETREFLAVIGLSGSGKSTLLRCINRLLDPTAGRMWVLGRETTSIKGAELRELRSDIGMIFQQFNLVRRHSVLANVLSGSLGSASLGKSLLMRFPPEEVERARAALKRVGLEGRNSDRADTLSGGQQQRVAVARALMQSPKLILADEPVASLDPALRHSVMRHIEALNREEGMTVICTLHDVDLIRRYATRLIALRDGELVFEGHPDGFDRNTFRDIYGEDAEPEMSIGD
ncbi:MAG: phosphonate ABC transporter ATP-binding protein [Acidobacteriota bacterium]|nr:phosphonate ABC transporter ATP-binding protein [Acidobacteriota bacterium]